MLSRREDAIALVPRYHEAFNAADFHNLSERIAQFS